ncbi:MAG TPA: OmpA family protein [Candidatus Limnocylindrales bacterium]|nr:OmpA family protein [Candidatus Limnocylindrales bacterium]
MGPKQSGKSRANDKAKGKGKGKAATGHPGHAATQSVTSMVTDLQRLAGNGALAGILKLQRWAGPEHEEIGDTTLTEIDLGGGLVLTWGQVIAIAGDQYGSLQELRDEIANNPGVLRHKLMHAGVRDPIPSALPGVPPGTGNMRYVMLAMENISHFGEGGTALETWRGYHGTALLEAATAGMARDEAKRQSSLLTEAFGQHFLTDMFSAGHVRTPRAAILAWYRNTFAPRVVPALRTWAWDRVHNALREEFRRNLPGPAGLYAAPLDLAIGALLHGFNAFFEQEVNKWVGNVVAGAISGALHDRDNLRGLWVSSEAHPDPWMTLGDGGLACSPVTREQVAHAVKAAKGRVDRAYAAGTHQRDTEDSADQTPAPANSAPARVHFGFDSSTLAGASLSGVDDAADYLLSHPQVRVSLVGHTDPTGSDGYNHGLGSRRADAVAARLVQRGVPRDRISVSSAGESQLLSGEPSGYALDRRVEFGYEPAPVSNDDGGVCVTPRQVVASDFPGPPYPNVERYLPREVVALNDPQEGWHWGELSSQMAAEVDTWIKGYVGGAAPGVLADPKWDDIVIGTPQPAPGRGFPMPPGMRPPGIPLPTSVTLHPRTHLEAVIRELLADPTGLLGRMFGSPAANHSVQPLPPMDACP